MDSGHCCFCLCYSLRLLRRRGAVSWWTVFPNAAFACNPNRLHDSAFVLAAIVLTDIVQVWYVIALAALTGLVNSIDAPARQALTPDLVKNRDDLPNAIAFNAMVFNGAR